MAAEMRTLRLIRGVTSLHRLRNEEIRADLHVEDILSYIERAQLRWFGHVKRMPPERLPRFWLDYKPTGKRSRGRPRTRFIDNISTAVEKRGYSMEDVERSRIFDNRDGWRALTTLTGRLA